MTAVKDDAIVVVQDTEITRPGPRLPTGLHDLAAAIRPDASLPAGAVGSAIAMSAGVAAPNLQRATMASRVRGRPGTVALGLVGALAVLLVTGVAIGSVPIAPSQTIAVIVRAALRRRPGVAVSPAVDTIVWDIRLPRVLTSFVVGAGLAVAGATFQGLLRNPLADPFVLGTASGAALGAAIAILLPVAFAASRSGCSTGFAFTGAVVAGRCSWSSASAGRAGWAG